MRMQVEVLKSGLLEGVRHGFLGRRGGVSQGVHAGLNVGLGSEDDRQAVATNRRLAAEAVAPGASLVTLHQVHSATAIPVIEPFPNDARPPADALVTNRPGRARGILTPDSTPVLFADSRAGVIGAAHSGWKGAIGGVVESTLAEMERLGADRSEVVAAVGPTIARKSYEVDEGFFRRFISEDPEHEHFFSAGKAGHYQFDLEGFVLARIAAAGVRRVEALGLDTYSDPDRFYSYRRATHQGESDYGRQISLIALP
jgi:YfiH family protein